MRKGVWALAALFCFGPAMPQPAAAPVAGVVPTATTPGRPGEAPTPAQPAPARPTAQPAPSPAGPPVYNVELIVFRATTALGGAENWSVEAGTGGGPVADSDPAAAAEPPREDGFVRQLAPTEFQLNDLDAKLRASGVYVPVAHVAWSQTASPWGSHAGIPVQRLGIDAPGLAGTVSLERGQYLHLGLALNYTMADPPAGLAAGPDTVFTLRDTHRVRFYDRNYFDHPAFGVIALVSPAQGPRRAGR
jgi:hypothetical protein